jgi:hypothetical protein
MWGYSVLLQASPKVFKNNYLPQAVLKILKNNYLPQAVLKVIKNSYEPAQKFLKTTVVNLQNWICQHR